MSLTDKLKAYSKIGLVKFGIAVHEAALGFDSLDGHSIPQEDAVSCKARVIIESDRWIACQYRQIANEYLGIGKNKQAVRYLAQAEEYDIKARNLEKYL